MLYRIFKGLFYLTVNGYFRRIDFNGLDNIPDKGPVIFMSNHTSAFMDPILLASHINRPVYFLARGESFKSKLVSLFYSWLHMIPIYKPKISPDEVHKNKEIFRRCYSHLAEGKTIMIFPEGISKTERKLRPFKTGAARIALGAEADHDFDLGVSLVPIGINYSNPHYFRSEVFIKVGKPINAGDYKQKYNEEPHEAARELTARVKSELERLVIVINDQKQDKLVKNIERLYSSQLNDDKPVQDFKLSKEIVKAVAYYQKIRPKETLVFEQRLEHYLDTLDRLNMTDAEIKDSRKYSKTLRSISYFIFGFPVFLIGFTLNIIPYKIAEALSRKVSVRKDFIGSMKLAFGAFVFLLVYILQIVVISLFTTWVIGIITGLIMYPSGLFTINYISQFYRVKGHQSFLRLNRKRSSRIKWLKFLRQNLIADLERGRELYLASR